MQHESAARHRTRQGQQTLAHHLQLHEEAEVEHCKAPGHVNTARLTADTFCGTAPSGGTRTSSRARRVAALAYSSPARPVGQQCGELRNMRPGTREPGDAWSSTRASADPAPATTPTCKPALQPGQQEGGLYRPRRSLWQHHAPCRSASQAQRLAGAGGGQPGWRRQRRGRRLTAARWLLRGRLDYEWPGQVISCEPRPRGRRTGLGPSAKRWIQLLCRSGAPVTVTSAASSALN